ncbi:ubiquitin-like protein [Apiospora rasikravindrae]|uniref:Ubiquitin-like protein n=1 Tax=Apiospora rasikravindrae TaxID=990691 RepID=A0ABR1RNT1_9PEZI
MAGEPVDQFRERIKSEQRDRASSSGTAGGSVAGREQANNDHDNGADKDNDEGNDMIKIRLRDSSKFQRESAWVVKKSETMWAHLQNYANSIQANFESLRFVTHEGSRINRTDTPESLELEDDEVIDVLPMTIGGQPCLNVT